MSTGNQAKPANFPLVVTPASPDQTLVTAGETALLDNLDAVCAQAVKRLRDRTARSAGQHKRALREMVKHGA